jgi:hypothetical protein
MSDCGAAHTLGAATNEHVLSRELSRINLEIYAMISNRQCPLAVLV